MLKLSQKLVLSKQQVVLSGMSLRPRHTETLMIYAGLKHDMKQPLATTHAHHKHLKPAASKQGPPWILNLNLPFT